MEWAKKHKILTVILLIIVIAVAANAMNGDSGTSTNQSNGAKSEESDSGQAATAKIGQPARDGKFEFTVTKMTCGQKTIGNNEFTQAKAQGEFCVMDVTIKNIGDEPQTLLADDQYVFNTSGQKYSYSDKAWLALDEITDVFLNEINPGNTVKGKIPFDVPKGTKVVKAELHDSSFSSGVEVDLK